MLIIKVSTFW